MQKCRGQKTKQAISAPAQRSLHRVCQRLDVVLLQDLERLVPSSVQPGVHFAEEEPSQRSPCQDVPGALPQGPCSVQEDAPPQHSEHTRVS